MPTLPIGPAGSIGIVKDTQNQELPLAAWTNATNMRFADGKASRIPGHRSVMGTPTAAPIWTMFVQVLSGPFWLYATTTKTYATDGSTHAEVTRLSGNYAGTLDYNWNGGLFGGVAIVNNGIDVPQQWPGTSVSTKMADLSNWPSTMRARSVRPFKNFLVALDVTESSNRFPQMVRWSHPADPGSVPSSWDYTDPTKDAGRVELKGNEDFLVDSLALKDTHILYRERSVMGMQFIGGVNIFRFFPIFSTFGLVSPRCAIEFLQNEHLVMSQDDVIRHDGQNASSILAGRWKRQLFSDMDDSLIRRSFLALNWQQREVWICYVSRGSSYCNMAVVWKFDENKLSKRELPQISHIAEGQADFSTVDPSNWDSDSTSWQSDQTPWDIYAYNQFSRRLVMASTGDTKLYGYPYQLSFDGADLTSCLERTGLGFPVRSEMPPDFSTVKSITRIWPRIHGDAGEVVNVYVGVQDKIESAPVYAGPYSYVIGETEWIDCLQTARIHAIKFEATGSFNWSLDGYEVDVVARGRV